jgi:hypothetical protein
VALSCNAGAVAASVGAPGAAGVVPDEAQHAAGARHARSSGPLLKNAIDSPAIAPARAQAKETARSTPSLAVHAVYDRWLPWLLLLDEEWVRDRHPSLFPNEPLETYRDVMRATYISWCPIRLGLPRSALRL